MRFLWIVFLSSGVTSLWSQQVQISTTSYEGREQFLITTASATYYYDKAGGGFSRVIDKDGKDWIAFKKEPWDEYPASAASAYRGIPNLVFRGADGGAGHPGHDQCISEVISDNAIRTGSKSGNWQWTWEFFDNYAQLRVQKVDPSQPYWFLYEGIPGGRFEPAAQYFGVDKGGPYARQPDYYAGEKLVDHWHWAYFGHRASARVLYVAQLRPDENEDTFSYLGNSAAGIRSSDGMVVFGFGRAEGARPLLKNPNTFLVGFYEQAISTEREHRKFARMMNKRLSRMRN